MFGRAITALITPFTLDDQVDFASLESLIQWHIESGTEGLVLTGSTGEGSVLSKEEKCSIYELAYHLGKGKIKLIANTGTNVTADSVWLTQKAKEIGMDGCLAIVPYYNKPTSEGCYQHFAKIAEVGLPLIAYHHPGRTGVKLSFEALCRICELDSIVGIKDATGDLNLAMDVMRKTKIPFYSGDDSLALAQFAIGFTGSISIVGNVIPKEWNSFVHTAVSQDLSSAQEQFYAFYDLVNAMILEVNPQCVKYAVNLLEKCSSRMRLPLIPPSFENQEKIKVALNTHLLYVKV